MKVEVAVLDFPSLIYSNSPMVSVDVKQYLKKKRHSKLRSCVKVEVAVLYIVIALWSLWT